jgi:uncharacterized protein (TIGR03435 family)
MSSRRHTGRPSRKKAWIFALMVCACCLADRLTYAQSAAAADAALPRPAKQEALLFEVATVKPSDPHRLGWKMQFTVNGFTARGVELRQVIQDAYGTYEENRLEGGPAWLKSVFFDIEAKIDVGQTPAFANLSLEQRRSMLQAMLADRFKLMIHRESRDLPVYALAVAKNGPRLHETNSATAFHTEIKGTDTLITKSGPGLLEGENFSMAGLALNFSGKLGRVVVDRTGLRGRYDIALRWTPDNLAPRGPGIDRSGDEATDTAWPSFFTAIQEQLGLKLEPAKAPVEVLVVDHAEMPSEN